MSAASGIDILSLRCWLEPSAWRLGRGCRWCWLRDGEVTRDGIGSVLFVLLVSTSERQKCNRHTFSSMMGNDSLNLGRPRSSEDELLMRRRKGMMVTVRLWSTGLISIAQVRMVMRVDKDQIDWCIDPIIDWVSLMGVVNGCRQCRQLASKAVCITLLVLVMYQGQGTPVVNNSLVKKRRKQTASKTEGSQLPYMLLCFAAELW